MNELADRIFRSPVSADAASGAATGLAREFEARMADSSTLAFHVAYAVLRHRQDAEDLAQDAFIRAHGAFHRLRDRDRFRAWLTRMVWRMAINYRRGQKNRMARENRVAAPDVAPSHEGAVLEGERSRGLGSHRRAARAITAGGGAGCHRGAQRAGRGGTPWDTGRHREVEAVRGATETAGASAMTHQDPDDPIAALRSELKRVRLSPEFTARLRQRIDAAPDPRRAARLGGWRWLVPAAAAAAVIALVMWPRRQPDMPAQVASVAPVAAPAVAGPQGGPGTSNVDVRTSKSELRRSKSEVRGSPALPAPEVITDQPAIFRALWARVARGAALVEVPAMPDPAPEIVVPSIEVDPIVVKALGELQLPAGVFPIVR
jgi:RNA polymerase sigma factor (sigma-70 family)